LSSTLSKRNTTATSAKSGEDFSRSLTSGLASRPTCHRSSAFMSTTPPPVELKLDLRAKRVINLRWKENLSHLVPAAKKPFRGIPLSKESHYGTCHARKRTNHIFFLPLTRGDVPTVFVGTEGLCDVATTPQRMGKSSSRDSLHFPFIRIPLAHTFGQASRLTADAKRHDCNGSNECLLSGGNSRQHSKACARAMATVKSI